MKMFSQKNKKPSSVNSGKDQDNFEDLNQFELTTKKSYSENRTEEDDHNKSSNMMPRDYKKGRKPNFFEKLKVMR